MCVCVFVCLCVSVSVCVCLFLADCFVGDNGVGKTNILDAIHYLSITNYITYKKQCQQIKTFILCKRLHHVAPNVCVSAFIVARIACKRSIV